DVLYRTYSSSRGWTNWAMNGGHTDWSADCPVEAVQIRLNGIFGDRFDVYYRSNLSDGTECDWSKNGGTNGAMACGRIITGMRFSMWGKGVDGAAYKMDNPLVSAAPDGIQFVNGTPVFSNGTGDNFTGWVWNDRDRYYVVDNAIVTGWQYIDGYKYYFEGDGKLVTDLEPYLNYQGQFKIKINKQMNCLTIYIPDGDNGYIIPYKSFLCSTGDDTPLGEHKTPEKYRWRLMNTDEYCQYLTRLDAGIPILLHSVIYERPDPYTLKAFTYNYLGATKSHGCIRLTTADSRWIYEHCALGTSITVYESPIPGPFDRPVIKTMIPDTQTYDPTDANVPENGLQ
ncbi:MAG: L,D-transpeptidase family protein, partial [Clostridium sp.]